MVTEVQQTAVLTLPVKKKMSPTAGPKITVTVDDSPISPKKRPAKTTMSLSDRFASKTVPQPKVSRVSVEGSKAQTNTVKKVLTKTMPSAEKMTSTNKGMNNISIIVSMASSNVCTLFPCLRVAKNLA